MKSTINDRLNRTFGVDAEEPFTRPMEAIEVSSSGDADKDMQADFDIARQTLRDLNVKATVLVNEAIYFAVEKQDSRSVEAAAIAQREARETALSLVGLHKTRRDHLERGSVKPGDTITQQNNVVFQGTTGELLQLTKELNAAKLLKDVLPPIDPPLNNDVEPNK